MDIVVNIFIEVLDCYDVIKAKKSEKQYHITILHVPSNTELMLIYNDVLRCFIEYQRYLLSKIYTSRDVRNRK